MSTQTISVAAAALGVGWGIGLVYPGSDLPSYAYYASPLELPLTLIALGLALALLFPSKKKAGALTKCPATAWPAGKPLLAQPADYAEYDQKDPKGSFNAICDMLIAEVKDELPKMCASP